MKRIKIDKVSEEEKGLDNFLAFSSSIRLKMFWINYASISDKPIKAKFYINSLSKAVSSVTKEVFIRLFEFSERDLEQFIKAACNAERVVLHLCSIHCSKVLDFGEKMKYKTKFLNFQWWGNTEWNELTTDWISNPSAFLNIVDAISNSGLRDSLTKISISWNQSLGKDEIQKLFNARNMQHISIVLENSQPLTA